MKKKKKKRKVIEKGIDGDQNKKKLRGREERKK